MASPALPQPSAPLPARCPVCQTPRPVDEAICPACGLVFASLSPAAPAPVTPQQNLARGRYAVQRVLSRGGMGAIYLAIDREVFGRLVVIKAMLDYFDPANPAEVHAARERFQSEARTLAMLRHPAIPQIYAYFEDAGRHYIVMEYIAGRDLDQQLTRQDERSGQLIPGQPYPREQVLGWGVALCKVLEYLAARQPDPVVHHDIKPANLLLDSESGELRLVDFGTARARLRSQASALAARGSGLFGTHGYAPPEQYRGESEPRSDVYALAATLYHLASDDDPGAHPFNFPQLAQLGDLGAALAPALQPKVARRPFAGELRAALEQLRAAPVAKFLRAPDGAALDDLVALGAWCESHWPQALDWLYADLPAQLALRLGETGLASRIEQLRLSHDAARHLALDTALALIDPQGYGAGQPHLAVAVLGVNFGRLRIDQTAVRALRMRNSGRRLLRASFDTPAWVSIDRQLSAGQGSAQSPHTRLIAPPTSSAERWRLLLPPQSELQLQLRADMRLLSIGGRLEDALLIDLEGADGVSRVDLAAHTPALRMFMARNRALTALIALALFAALLWALIFYLPMFV